MKNYEVRRNLSPVVIVSCVLLVFAAATTAAALTPIPVTTCQTIAHSGLFVVQNNLNATSGDCIVIAARSVTLALNGYTLTGGGTGAGVHVRGYTSRFALVTGVFIQGGGATISGFAYGIRNDAIGTGGDNFSLQNNTADGLLIYNAWGSSFFINDVSFNSGSGVHIFGGGNNLVSKGTAGNNATYGAWVQSSSGNSIVGLMATNNGIAGVYIGCNPAFNGKSSRCGRNPSSDGNFVYDNSAAGNSFGVVIDADGTANSITNNNVFANTNYDAVDENANCDADAWFGNFAGMTKNLLCIQ